jgi:predicted nucleic acid-binding Zn ribbon protein
MPTYVYETIPQKPRQKPLRFEIKQSMMDATLTRHPDTGAPVRRVIAGGIGVITQRTTTPHRSAGGCCGGGGCACGGHH